MIPGQNLLNMALTVIAKQTVVYYKFLSRSLNDVGQDITLYESPVEITGSFQPVSKNLYDQFGLDLQKSYFNLYSSNDIVVIMRDVSGDQIEFQGNRYQCESSSDWFGLDGWKGILCVRIRDVIP